MSSDPAGPSGNGAPPGHVPIESLLDLEALRSEGREPTPRELRARLPRGWVLDPDHRHAHRDVRLFFREGWILLSGLGIFGVLGGLFVWGGLPRGLGGLVKLGLGLLVIVVAGGIAGPLVTRSLARRR